VISAGKDKIVHLVTMLEDYQMLFNAHILGHTRFQVITTESDHGTGLQSADSYKILSLHFTDACIHIFQKGVVFA
jgi:hypothetical protein